MFRSLHMKLVMIMLLLVTSLMAVVERLDRKSGRVFDDQRHELLY